MSPGEIKKVVVIGPESTGKSTLCQHLAAYYHTIWCPEYAREYLLKHGMNYSFGDLLTIAKGQIELEERTIQLAISNWQPAKPHSSLTTHRSLLFIDTNMYVMKVWSEFVFGKCHQFIIDEIEKRKYDLYLLCNIDLPWIEDEFRKYPDLERRLQLYKIYKDIMSNQTVPWVEISGNYEERLEKAIVAVDKLLKE